MVVGVLAAAGVVTAGALAGGSGPHNTTTKHGTGGGRHNTGTDEATTAAPETPSVSDSTQTTTAPPPVDPLVPVAVDAFEAWKAAQNLTKADMRDDLRVNTIMMAAFCQRAFTEPGAYNLYWGGPYDLLCRLMIVIVLAESKIVRDPPDPKVMEVTLPAPTLLRAVTVRCPKRVARRTCAALTAPVLSFINAVATAGAAATGAATTLERLGGAATAGSAPGAVLQSAAAKAYARELASTIAKRQAAGRILAAVLRKTRLDGPTSSRDLQAITKKLGSADGLPASFVVQLVTAGLTTGTAQLSQTLRSALQGLPKTVSLTAFLGAASSTVDLAKLNRALTLPELAALVRGLASQGALSTAARDVLIGDLRRAATAAPTSPSRPAAVSQFVKDVGAQVTGAAATLLTAAAMAFPTS